MHLTRLWAAALAAVPASAFRDTSPFMFFSTSEILFESPAITTASSLTKSFASALRDCPSRSYIILNQPGVHSDDYGAHSPAANLQQLITGEDKVVRSARAVAEVKGEFDREMLVGQLRERCGAEVVDVRDTGKASPRLQSPKQVQNTGLKAKGSTSSTKHLESPAPKVFKVDLPGLDAVFEAKRSLRLRENDLWLSNFIQSLLGSNHTVVYATTRRTTDKEWHKETPSSYQMDSSMSPLGHMELKRDLESHVQSASNVTLVDGPLFERYQYLTPGLFMGLLALFFLGLILYIAINAVASLEVSYAAFDKETGPSAQKKQQ